MSRIAFAQFNPGNLRKLHTRILGLLNQHVAEVCRASGVLPKWIYKVVVVGNTCMHHVLLGIDPSYVGLAPYAPVMRHALTLQRARAVPEGRAGGARVPAAARGRLRRRRRGGRRAGHADLRGRRRSASPSTSAPTARCCSARRRGCGRARRRPAPPSRAARSATACAARTGAIDRVTVDDDLHVHTIGEADALGICGSGLLDLVAGLLEAGVIDWTGLIQVEQRDALPPRAARPRGDARRGAPGDRAARGRGRRPARDRPHPGRRAAAAARQGRDRLRHRDAAARGGRAGRATWAS